MKIAIKFGIWMFVGYMIFFLIMNFLDLSDNYILRILNAPIQFLLIYIALGEYYEHELRDHHTRFHGFRIGVAACLIGVVLFAAFQYYFLTSNPVFFENLKKAFSFLSNLTPLKAVLIMMAEGMAFGVISVYFINKYMRSHLKEVFK